MKLMFGDGIEDGKWQIRNFREDDLPALVKYANNRKVSINLRDIFPYPYTEADGRKWLEYVLNQERKTNFAIASDTELIGGIGVTFQDDVHRLWGRLGYWIGEPFWGQGIVPAAVGVFVPYAFDTFGFVRISADVYARNRGSARVLEKNGFTFEGRMRKAVVKEGEICDILIYSILAEEI